MLYNKRVVRQSARADVLYFSKGTAQMGLLGFLVRPISDGQKCLIANRVFD